MLSVAFMMLAEHVPVIFKLREECGVKWRLKLLRGVLKSGLDGVRKSICCEPRILLALKGVLLISTKRFCIEGGLTCRWC